MLEALFRGTDEVLLLDEPDNYLDVPGKLWLEERLRETQKTVLLVSHDRELLAGAARQIVTVEDANVWVHGGGFATYAEARRDRNSRLEELRRRWDEEHAKLKALVLMFKQKAAYNSDMSSRYQAAQTRLRACRAALAWQRRHPRESLRQRCAAWQSAHERCPSSAWSPAAAARSMSPAPPDWPPRSSPLAAPSDARPSCARR